MRAVRIVTRLLATASALAGAPAFAQNGSWSGFYIGANGTGAHDRVSAEATLQINQISNLFVAGRGIVVVPGTTRQLDASESETNWFGGVQAGYQWQAGAIVFGAEAEYDPLGRNATVSQTFTLPITILAPATTVTATRDVRINSQWSVRGRIGVAFGRTLAYATAGYASARTRMTSIDSYTNPGGAGAPNTDGSTFNGGPEGPVVTTASARRSMGGWTGGVGIEQALGSQLSVALEFRHTNLGARDFTPTNATTVNTGPETRGTNGATGLLGSVANGPTRSQLDSNAVSLRLNFRF